ncbi:MAG: tyrosine-type recombinase/integrase [Chloroflexi bacterium]|nr:tyrosine-type recombinase/integrase [Chloroflexota bacterium]
MRAVAAAAPEPSLDRYRLAEVVEEYLVALRVAGRSPRTIDWYRANLMEFMRFLERDGRTATVADLQPVTVRRWLLALNARPTALAPSSLAGRVRTIKAFGTWIAAELDLPANPVRAVPIPRVPDQLVPSLRDHEIARLVHAATESRQPQRDLALILLMIDTGMRLSEVAWLKVGDVDLIEGRCRVMGKGSRERVVPIGRRTRKALRGWSSARRLGMVGNSPLFIGPRGSRLSARGIHQLVHRLASRAGIQTRCSPHILRHTFARAFLTNGGDVFSLQRILGHSPHSIQVTRRYVELLDDDLRAVHRVASPADRIDVAQVRSNTRWPLRSDAS